MKLIKQYNNKFYITSDDVRTPQLKTDELIIDEYNQVGGFVDLSDIGLGYGNIRRIIASTEKDDGVAMIDKRQIFESDRGVTCLSDLKIISNVDVELTALLKIDELNIIEPRKRNDYFHGALFGYEKSLQDNSDKLLTIEQIIYFANNYVTANWERYTDKQKLNQLEKYLNQLYQVEWSVEIEEVTVPTYSKVWDKLIGETRPKINEKGFVTIKSVK